MQPPAVARLLPEHVDEKGRTKLPPPFAAALGASFIATRGLDGCIWLLPHSEWQRLVEPLQPGTFGTRATRRLQRFFIGGAVECSLDAQGRLSLPAALRNYAGIQAEILIAGVGPWVEVWSRQRWSAEAETLDATEVDELLRSARLEGTGQRA